jgi:hypothetical protein
LHGLPKRYANPGTVAKRCYGWRKARIWGRVFAASFEQMLMETWIRPCTWLAAAPCLWVHTMMHNGGDSAIEALSRNQGGLSTKLNVHSSAYRHGRRRLAIGSGNFGNRLFSDKLARIPFLNNRLHLLDACVHFAVRDLSTSRLAFYQHTANVRKAHEAELGLGKR